MAYDVFMKVDGIDGESTDDAHAGWIELLSFSHGVSQPSAGAASSGGGRHGQRVDVQDFTVVKSVDKASPKLFLACCKGDHISEILVELCRATGDKTKYMEYKLTDVVVSSVRPGGSANGGESLPLEEISFNPGRIDYTYTETDHNTGAAKGDVTAYWDQTKNVGG